MECLESSEVVFEWNDLKNLQRNVSLHLQYEQLDARVKHNYPSLALSLVSFITQHIHSQDFLHFLHEMFHGISTCY